MQTIGEAMIDILFGVDKQSQAQVQSQASALKNGLKSMLGKVGITLSIAGVAKFTKDAISAASAAQEMQQKFNTVFGDYAQEANDYAESYANAYGRSKNKIKTYYADMQNLMVGFMGQDAESRKKAMELTKQMTNDALNIASFANMDEDQAVDRMTKAVMGEAEAARGLGAALNDSTRAQAMQEMGIEGTYSKLDQVTKMMVNLHAIESQSMDAIGTDMEHNDLANSMEHYESKSRQLNAAIEDFRTNIGTYLIPLQTKLIEYGTKIVNKIVDMTSGLGSIDDEGSKAYGVYQKFCEVLEAGYNWLMKTGEEVKTFVDRVGGVENAVKIFASLFAVLKGGDVIFAGLKKIDGIVGTLKKGKGLLSAFNRLKTVGPFTNILKGLSMGKFVAILGVAAAIGVVIFDIFNFMTGKSSLLGKIINDFGGDAESVKKVFTDAIESIKKALSRITIDLKPVKEELMAFWKEYGPGIMMVLNGLYALVVSVFAGIFSAIGPVINFIIDSVKFIIDLFTGNFSALPGDLSDIFNDIGSVFEGLVGGIWDTFNSILGGLPGQMLQWAKDAIGNFISGIKDGIGDVGLAIKGVAGEFGALHHSVPKYGPLKDDDKWMPDFMDNLVRGINNSRFKLNNAVKGVAETINSGLLGGNSASYMNNLAMMNGRTLGNSNTRSSSVVQNVTFSNTFNGTYDQRQASNQMQSNAKDTSSYLAHALAYGR